MHTHDGVVAERADEASFLAVVRATVIMIVNAIGEFETRAKGWPIEPASKVDPLAAIAGPRLAAECFRNAGRD